MNDIIAEDCERILDRLDVQPLQNARVLVTGAGGFIGQYIVSLLYAANCLKKLRCHVYCVGLHAPKRFLRSMLSDKHIRYTRIDLSRPFRLTGTFDYIFHAACYGQPAKFIAHPLPTVQLNTTTAIDLLDIAERSKGTFVFFSSAEIYGDVPRGVVSIPEDYTGGHPALGARAIYGESKRLGEIICSVFARERNVRVKIIRISHLYGPGTSIHDTRVLGDFIRKALIEKKILLFDKGKAVKTYGYVADAAHMIMHVALRGKEMIYNIGGVDTVSIRELAKRVGSYCHVPVRLPRQNSRLSHIGNDPQFVRLDLSRILKELKSFSFTPMRNGLARTIEWNRSEFRTILH